MNLCITAKTPIISSAMAFGKIIAQIVVLYMALFNLPTLVKWRFARLTKLFNCYYARKSEVNRIIHHRKYATFPICPKGFNQAAREM